MFITCDKKCNTVNIFMHYNSCNVINVSGTDRQLDRTDGSVTLLVDPLYFHLMRIYI